MPDIPMHVDHGDEWPDVDPTTPGHQYAPGTFEISLGGVQGYPQATAVLEFGCPRLRHCAVLLGPAAVPRPTPEGLCVWGWDGNLERPTLTPSLNCLATTQDGKPSGGCGWHGFIRAGLLVGA